MSELEEIEREDNFRLKRFKELKTKKNKGGDDIKRPCFCDKKPGKGDDFKCSICKLEEDKSKSKNNASVFKTPSCMTEVIGDKASTLCTANKKCLDDLTTHLEKVISLTGYCKAEGLVSSSVDTFIYACKEVRCKLDETDQIKIRNQTAQDPAYSICEVTKNTSPACDICNDINDVSKDVPFKNCSESKKLDVQDILNVCNHDKVSEAVDSFGCFETKYEEIVKVKKLKNEYGTISEEKQVITIKTERKCPQNINTLGVSCCKIKRMESFGKTSGININCNDIDDRCCKKLRQSKSENRICCCIKKKQEKLMSCISDLGKDRKKETKTHLKSNSCNTATDPKTPSVFSFMCCNKKCPSVVESIKSSDLKISESCKICVIEPGSTTLSITSHISCPKKCQSAAESVKSSASAKSSQKSNEISKTDSTKVGEPCSCKDKKLFVIKNKTQKFIDEEISKTCKKCSSAPKTPFVSSYTCPKKCLSTTENIKSKIQAKASKTSIKSLYKSITKKGKSCKVDKKSVLEKTDRDNCSEKEILEYLKKGNSLTVSKTSSVSSYVCCPNKCPSAAESITSLLAKSSKSSKKTSKSHPSKTNESCLCSDKKTHTKQTETKKSKDKATPSVLSYTCCAKKCCSKSSTKSKVSTKSSKISTKVSRKINKACECKVERKSVSCDAVWKDVACSATKLPENCNEKEELLICAQETDLTETNKKIKKSTVNEKSSANSVYSCCQKEEVEKKQSRTCNLCSKAGDQNAKKDVSTATSNINIEQTGILKEKPIVKSDSCCVEENDNKKTSSTSKMCCKIKIISKDKDESENQEEKVQEIIFFGNILDAIKQILNTRNSDQNIDKRSKDNKTTDSDMKSCSCTQKKSLIKSSVKSSVCKTCGTESQVPSDDVGSSTYVSCKSVERSRSCPQCKVKNDDKSFNWSRQKSKSYENVHCCKSDTNMSFKSICSLCGSEISKATSAQKCFKNSSETDKYSRVSCNDSCISLCKNATGPAINLNNKILKKDSCRCQSTEDLSLGTPSVTTKPSTCKMCQTERPSYKPNIQKSSRRLLKVPQSCPASKEKQKQSTPKPNSCYSVSPQSSRKYSKSSQFCPVCAKKLEQMKPDANSYYSVPNATSAKSLCSGCVYPARSSRENSSKVTTEECCVEPGKKDASTSTKRTDRFDVRPLVMVKSQKKPICTCHSDSYLLKKVPRLLKRSKSCFSCRGDYCR